MTIFRQIVVAAVIATFLGCSSTRGEIHRDPSFNYSGLRTFNWHPPQKDAQALSELVTRRIQRAVQQELEAKGYVMSPEQPDFLVDFYGWIEDKIETENFGYEDVRKKPQWIDREPSTTQYREGTLILDCFDAASDEIFWRGSINKVIDNPSPTPEQSEKAIGDAVAQILERFPARK